MGRAIADLLAEGPDGEGVEDLGGAAADGVEGAAHPVVAPPPILVVAAGASGLAYRIPYSNGYLCYYESSQSFVAECNIHGRCRRTRTAKAGSGQKGIAQGRPLGQLAAWLEMAQADQAASAWGHKWEVWPDLEQRRAARQRLVEIAEFRTLLDKERPKREGEGDEPEALA